MILVSFGSGWYHYLICWCSWWDRRHFQLCCMWYQFMDKGLWVSGHSCDSEEPQQSQVKAIISPVKSDQSKYFYMWCGESLQNRTDYVPNEWKTAVWKRWMTIWICQQCSRIIELQAWKWPAGSFLPTVLPLPFLPQISKPYIVAPHPDTSWTLPGTVTPSPSWKGIPVSNHSLREEVFPYV